MLGETIWRQAITSTKLIVNQTFMNASQRNFDQNWNILIQGNTFENAFCKMSAFLFVDQQATHHNLGPFANMDWL